MGQLETDAVLAGIVSETIGEGESFTLRSVRDARVPHGITKFLFAQTLERYSHERRVDPGHGPVVDALLRTLVLEHRYDRGEYLASLKAAIEFLTDYLVHPRESLLRWITEQRDKTSVAALGSRIAAIHDYRYLTILLSAWLRRRRVNVVTREELRTVIGAVDDRVVAKHSPDELGLLARPMFMFVRYGGSREVPISALREFYIEKKLDTFWDGIQQRLGPGVQSVTLAGLLDAIRPEGEEARGKKEEARSLPDSVPALSGRGGQETGGKEQEARGKEQQARSKEQEAEPAVIPAGDPPPELVETVASAEPRAQVVAPEPPLPPPGPFPPLPDLSSLIPVENRAVFVNTVFGRDADYYTAVIASLNGIATWKDAALFLSQFYLSNGLDPFADEVVEFTDAVHHRYDYASRR